MGFRLVKLLATRCKLLGALRHVSVGMDGYTHESFVPNLMNQLYKRKNQRVQQILDFAMRPRDFQIVPEVGHFTLHLDADRWRNKIKFSSLAVRP